MVTLVRNGHGDPISNPGRICISHCTNTPGKGYSSYR